jgi:hypothetical protein
VLLCSYVADLQLGQYDISATFFLEDIVPKKFVLDYAKPVPVKEEQEKVRVNSHEM